MTSETKFADKRLSEAVELLATMQADVSQGNQRRISRVNVRTKVQIIPMHEGSACQAQVVELSDISPRGVRFTSSMAMERGSQFALQLPSKPGAAPQALVCMVVHCRENSGKYTVGAEVSGLVQKSPSSENSDEQRRRIQKSMFG